MNYTNIGLVDYAAKWLGLTTRYGWGCWGQAITESIIMQKYNQYPGHYDSKRRAELRQLINQSWLIDCVGLIKGYYWGQTPGGSVGYDGSTDVSANDMYNRAVVKGPIGTMPEVIGLCVQMDGHIGIYAGNGLVIECTRSEVFGDGVVTTQLSDRFWTHWLECPYINYVKEEENMPEQPTGNNPSNWAKESTEWAIGKEYVNGDGNGNYDWQKPMTREAFATILHAFAKANGLD